MTPRQIIGCAMAVIGVALVIGGLLWLVISSAAGRRKKQRAHPGGDAAGRRPESPARASEPPIPQAKSVAPEQASAQTPGQAQDASMGDDEIERAAFELVRKESEGRQ